MRPWHPSARGFSASVDFFNFAHARDAERQALTIGRYSSTRRTPVRRTPKAKRPLAWQCTGGLAFLDSNAPKRPQEQKCPAKNGDSQQAKHDYCHPRNLS